MVLQDSYHFLQLEDMIKVYSSEQHQFHLELDLIGIAHSQLLV